MMKKQLFFMLVALFMVGVNACKDSDNGTPDDPNGGGGNLEVTLTAKPELVSFVSTSTDSCKLYLEGNASWRIKATVDWCTFSKYSGEGTDSVTVYVGDNDQVDKRSGEIVITGAKEPVKIPVVQFGRGVQFLTFVGGDAIPEDKVVELDFESFTYKFSFVSNVTFEAILDQATKNTWISEASEQDGVGDSNYPGYGKGIWRYVHLSDNQDSHARESFYVLKQSGGTATDTVYIRQKGYEPFLRFFSDTIYIGSHFRQLNISGWGDVAWNYEFLDDNNHTTAAPSWIKNVYKRGEKTLSRLGTTQTLTGDVDMNESNEPRHVKVRFYYDVKGQPMENILTLIQRENDPWASDSLALMKIAEQNASESGLTVSWELGKPMETWPDLGWVYDEDNHKRVDVVLLGGAHMIDDLSPDICNLTAVTTLLMGRNYLTGIPKEIGMLENLTTLDLSDNINDNLGEGPISGIKELPAEIFTGCKKLQELNLSRNRLTKVPGGISNLTELKNLDLSANFIKEFPLEEMGALQNLEVLNLGGNTYAGVFPEFIFDLSKLTQISLTKMNFQGAALPDRFASLPELRQFNCNFCNLGGELPVSLSECSKLVDFSAGAATDATYWIAGALPSEYAGLDSLASLDLSNNKITGNIPEEYVSFLDLYKRSYNQKEGSGQRFLSLWLGGNCMSGTIPEKIVTHPGWKDEYVTYEGKEVKLTRMNPTTEICPQRDGFGFTNCPVK